MGWKEDARRLVISQKYELESFPGFWITAKKYSIAAKDEIGAAVRKMQRGIDKKSLSVVLRKCSEIGKEVTEENILDVLTDEELIALADSSAVDVAEVTEIRLRHGIADHNFEGSDVKELAHDLLEYPEICSEILKIVEGFNRPLAVRSDKSSQM